MTRKISGLHRFDQLISKLEKNNQSGASAERQAVALLAGYIATVAAGGAPSLSLAERNSRRWPEIIAWAYVLGGIGEHVVWTSSFDGLGRLVIRELMRTFRLDDSPMCDCALDEAQVLFDPQLSDPFVHLRIKQSRIVTVSTAPGVNIFVSMGEETAASRSPHSQPRVQSISSATETDLLALLADAIWPYLRDRFEDNDGQTNKDFAGKSRKGRIGRREGRQTKLPLK
jgi:hypothetical protein